MQGKLQDGSIIICGVLGNDAEHKQVGDKQSHLTKFSVKVGEKPSADVTQKAEAVWVNCACWNTVAKAASDLKKLDVVFCIGKVKTNEKDGNVYKTLECEGVFKMGGACSIQSQQSKEPLPANLNGFEEILGNDDDLPF